MIDFSRRAWAVAPLLASLIAGSPMVVAASSPVIGWIEIAPAGPSQITVIGHAFATATTSGQFVLSLHRVSKGNSANTGQSGGFKVAAGEDATLSKTAINVVPGEELIVELKLMIEGREVHTAVLRPAGGAPGRDP